MNKPDIDTMSTRELDAAVEIALGGAWLKNPELGKYALYDAGTIRLYPRLRERETVEWADRDMRTEWWDIGLCHHSADIAAAWELDGDGWEWTANEYIADIKYLHLRAYDNKCKKGPFAAIVHFDDFPTKAAAYATARCRVWLKAQEAAQRPPGARSLLTALADYCEFTPRGQALARVLQGGAQ